MNWLQNISIKRKLMVITLLTSSAALLLAYVFLVTYEIGAFKRQMVNDLTAQAKILGGLSTAALTFNEPQSVREMLNELSHEPSIAGAAIYRDGTIFAQYVRPGESITPEAKEPSEERVRFTAGRLDLVRKVILKGETIGTVVITLDTKQLSARFWRFGAILLGVFLASAVIAFLFSSKLQHVISKPILSLAETATSVATRKDYALRAPLPGRDELGQLTQTFNQMLDQIQEQDEALSISRHKLETLVHSIEGIVLECDAKTFAATFVSRQSERLLGFSAAEWLSNPTFWQEHLHAKDAARALQARHDAVDREQPFNQEYRFTAADGRNVWIRESGAVLADSQQAPVLRVILLDVSVQKKAAEELDELNRKLVETSRRAGMAEVATGVLHNVGNVLNSVNVSLTLVRDRLRRSEIDSLLKVAKLIRSEESNLDHFFTQNPKGRLVPQFIMQVADQLVSERQILQHEHEQLMRNVDHIKEIVSMQQSYASVSGILETVSISGLVDDALQLHTGGLDRHGVKVVRNYSPVPPLLLDKHKVLQILVNLVHNAKYAITEANPADRQLTVTIRCRENQRVQVSVSDNGIGIPVENLTRIFSHGFTTRKGGHGFGLHSGAIAAKEMGGTLLAESRGPGHGATFILELPVSCSKSNYE